MIPKKMEERILRLEKKALEISKVLSEKGVASNEVDPKISYSSVKLNYPHFTLIISEDIRVEFSGYQYHTTEESLGAVINYEITNELVSKLGHEYVSKLHHLDRKIDIEEFAMNFLPYVQITNLSKDSIPVVKDIVREVLGHREILDLSNRDVHVHMVARPMEMNSVLSHIEERIKESLGLKESPQVSIEFP